MHKVYFGNIHQLCERDRCCYAHDFYTAVRVADSLRREFMNVVVLSPSGEVVRSWNEHGKGARYDFVG